MARPPRASPVLACLAIALGCAEVPPPDAPSNRNDPPTVKIPSTKASAEPVVTLPPVPVLAPLVVDPRPPCDVAADHRKAADDALAAGRAYRAVRRIAKADATCPSAAQSSWKTKLVALGQLERDDDAQKLAREVLAAASVDPAVATEARAALAKVPPKTPPSSTKLLTAALAAHKSGAADARAQLDRALARLEIENAAAPAAHFDVGERTPLALAADGATAVIAQGPTAILVDTKDLSPRRFFDHKRAVAAATLSADGRFLATVDEIGDTAVWLTASGKLLRRFTWAGEKVTRVAFSPDAKRLVTAGGTPFDTAVRVWNAENGDSVEAFTIGGAWEATALAVSPDGKLLAIGTKVGTVELWRLGPAKQIATLAKPDSFIESTATLDFTAKSDRLLAVSGGGSIKVWETAQGKLKLDVRNADRTRPRAAVFSPDGTRILGSGRPAFDWALQEWDAASGAELKNEPVPIGVDLFSRDGKVGIGPGKEPVRPGASGLGVLDIATRTAITSVQTGRIRFRSVAFGPPRTLALSVEGEKVVRVFTPRGARQIPGSETYGDFALSLDGRAIATVDHRALNVWDLTTGAPLPAYPPLPDSSDSVSFGPTGLEIRVAALRYDGLTISTASPGQASWKEVYDEGKKGRRNLVLSAYGRFALLEEERRVLLLDLATGRTSTLDDDPKERIQAMDVSADGAAAFVVRDEKVTRFDTATGKVTHGPTPIGCYATGIVSSFDGSKAVSWCFEDPILTSFPAGQPAPAPESRKLALKGRGGLELAPHGDLVVSHDEEGGVRLWTLAGALRAELFPFGGADATLLRSQDGRVSLLGKDTASADRRLWCRVGPVGVPFVVCADALTDEDLLQEALAPSP